MKIIIEVVDHKDQRYETVGDWYLEEDGLHVTVSKLGDFYQEMCVGVHELVEALLCMKRGISQHEVDLFDKQFETQRQEGNTDEPGDSPNAPYRKEHFFATSIERLLCAELGIDWIEYEKRINEL